METRAELLTILRLPGMAPASLLRSRAGRAETELNSMVPPTETKLPSAAAPMDVSTGRVQKLTEPATVVRLDTSKVSRRVWLATVTKSAVVVPTVVKLPAVTVLRALLMKKWK